MSRAAANRLAAESYQHRLDRGGSSNLAWILDAGAFLHSFSLEDSRSSRAIVAMHFDSFS